MKNRNERMLVLTGNSFAEEEKGEREMETSE